MVKLIAEGSHPRDRGAADDQHPHRGAAPGNILAKLGMRDRTEITRYAIRVGLIEP